MRFHEIQKKVAKPFFELFFRHQTKSSAMRGFLFGLAYVQQVKSRIKYLNKQAKNQIDIIRKPDRCIRFGSSRNNIGNRG